MASLRVGPTVTADGRLLRRVGHWSFDPWVVIIVVSVIAIAVRLIHVFTTARMVVMGDSVGFEIHAKNFLRTWHALGTVTFLPTLLDTIDNASLQGIVYPFVQSLVFLGSGGVHYDVLVVVQACISGLTAGVATATAWRIAGPVAAWVTGVLCAFYEPLVLTAGSITAEAVLIALQSGALWCIVEAILRRPTRRSIWFAVGGGFLLGLTMLRPALQFTGLLLLIGAGLGMALQQALPRAGITTSLVSRRHLVTVVATVGSGLLIVATPWWLTNAIAFADPVWSRTGNSWQQVYWGIYPPNRAWQPQDAPVPPKYGVESLPEARMAGAQIDVRDLDYLDAAIAQVVATPVEAIATMTNKLVSAWRYPWNPFAEHPPIASALIPVLHPFLLTTMALGIGGLWRRPVVGTVTGAFLVAAWLPYLAVNIDVRYPVTPGPINAVFGGIAVADLLAGVRHLRHKSLLWASTPFPRVAVASSLLGALLAYADTAGLLAVVPDGLVTASQAHLITSLGLCITTAIVWSTLTRVAAIGAIGTEIVAPTPVTRTLTLAPTAVAVALLAIHAWFAPEWHEWTTDLAIGDRASQTLTLPAGWQTPPGSIVELRLWLQGGRTPTYEPVVRVNGVTIANFRPAFDDAGSLRFPESALAYAQLQGKTRADVPQWYAIRLNPLILEQRSLTIEIEAAGVSPSFPRDPQAWIRVWGDFPPSPARTAWDATDPQATAIYEGPALYSRRAGADHSSFRFIATGDTLIWRRTALQSMTSRPIVTRAGPSLQDARTRHGTLRIRVLVLDPTYALIAAF